MTIRLFYLYVIRRYLTCCRYYVVNLATKNRVLVLSPVDLLYGRVHIIPSAYFFFSRQIVTFCFSSTHCQLQITFIFYVEEFSFAMCFYPKIRLRPFPSSSTSLAGSPHLFLNKPIVLPENTSFSA